jgi:hypothetical protein
MSFSLGELYHDTLGLPLQVLLRTGRAIRDPNISLWDRKGLLDPDLIPGVNLLFNTGDDATAKDLGIENPWAQFAVETALDPVTYLTAGLSASGKAARAVNMAFNGPALSRAALSGELKAGTKIGEMAQMAEKAIKDGAYESAGELRALQQVSVIGPEFKDMGFQELLGHAKDRELMVAIPGLTKFGAAFTVRTPHRSWFSLAGSNVGAFYRTAYAASGIRQIPGVRGVLQRTEKALDAFSSGLRRPTGPIQTVKPAESVLDRDDAQAAMEMLWNGGSKDPELDGWAKKLYERAVPRLDSLGKNGVTATYEKQLRSGQPVEAAFLRALGIRVPSALDKTKKQARAYLRVLTANPDAAFPATGRELEGMAARFRGDYAYAGEILQRSEVNEALTPLPALPEAEAKYFRAGQETRRVWNKLFRSDLGPESLLPADKALRSWEAASSEMVQSQARLLYRARPRIAQEVFGGTANPVQTFDRAIRNYFEARFEPELLSGMADDITSEGGSLRFRRNLGNFLSRAKTNTAVLSKLLRLKDPKGKLPDLLRVMDQRTGDFPAITHTSREVERHALDHQTAAGLLGNGAPAENAFRAADQGPFLGHLGDQELTAIVSRETLSAKDSAVQEAARTLLEYRRAGLAAKVERGAPVPTEDPVPFREIENDFLATALTEGGRQPSGPLEESFLKLVSFQAEFADWTRRTKKAGYALNPSAAMWRQFEEAATGWNTALDDIMGRGMGKSGAKYFDAVQQVQRRVAEHGIRSGLLTDGHYPLGYLPRISSGAVQRAMRELGNEIPDDVRGVLTPQVGQEFARSLDALTLDQVNALHETLLKQKRPELAAKLEGILARDGVKLSVLEDDPASAFLTALGNAESAANTADFTRRVLTDSKSHTLAGRIFGYWQKDGGAVKFGTGSQVRGKLEGRKITAQLGAREQAELPYTAILMETEKGVVSVPVGMLDKGFRFMHLGAIGEDAGSAFAHRAARGNLTAAVHAGENLNTPTLAGMAGDWAVVGTDAHLGALANSVTSQQTAFADAMRFIDGSNHFLRKWQTVYRPAFHAANISSGAFQGMILGTSLRNTVGGHLDAARMLFGGGAELAVHQDRMAALLGEAHLHQAGGFGPPATVKRAIAFIEAARRIGPRGKPLSRSQMDAMGLSEMADLIIEGPQGERFSGTQILYAAARGELLGTFAARGFEGGSATTRAMLKERQLGERLAGPGRAFSKTTARFQGATEISEVYSRMSALIGRIREGVPLEMAVSEVKDAFVDYSQLTKFERSFLKRGLTYYTFARHYVPFFLKQASESPRAIGPWVHALNTSGAFTTTDGQVQLKAGNWRVAAQRLNANLDALMAAPALLESITDIGRGAEDLVNDLQKPGFLTTGGLLGVLTGSDALFHTDDRRPRKNWLEDAFNSTWASRWALMGASALVPGLKSGAPPSILEEAARLMVPVSEVGPQYEQRLILRNYQVLLAQIRFQSESTPSAWRRQRLKEEAVDLRQALDQALEREGVRQ